MFCCLFGVLFLLVFLFLFDDGVGWCGVGCQRSCSCYADDVTLIMGRGGWGGMVTFMFRLPLMMLR